jgi:pimeloyl-ACP methyl ester carboxylesterase
MRPGDVTVHAGEVVLEGALSIPERAGGVVLFAHGSGSSRFSPRNRFVADFLNDGGLGTLLFDLLTAEESEIDERSGALRFDIDLLSRRLVGAVDWTGAHPPTRDLQVGLFGASTGAAAALNAAADRPQRVAAVVSRGGRPDLAMAALPGVRAPTLLIVGGLDGPVIGMNQRAAAQLACEHRLEIVPGATHLFEEPGKLEEVARLARNWFQRHLGGAGRGAGTATAARSRLRV